MAALCGGSHNVCSPFDIIESFVTCAGACLIPRSVQCHNSFKKAKCKMSNIIETHARWCRRIQSGTERRHACEFLSLLSRRFVWDIEHAPEWNPWLIYRTCGARLDASILIPTTDRTSVSSLAGVRRSATRLFSSSHPAWSTRSQASRRCTVSRSGTAFPLLNARSPLLAQMLFIF